MAPAKAGHGAVARVINTAVCQKSLPIMIAVGKELLRPALPSQRLTGIPSAAPVSLAHSGVTQFSLLSLPLLSWSFSHVSPRGRKPNSSEAAPHAEARSGRDGLRPLGGSGTQQASWWPGPEARAERWPGGRNREGPFSKLALPVPLSHHLRCSHGSHLSHRGKCLPEERG